MSHKELQQIIGTALKYYTSFETDLKLPGMNKPLDSKELVALSYFNSVVQYLSSKGLVDGSKINVDFVTEDSNTREDDYE